jgi:uncharacterized protein (DUF1778 family)
MLSPRRIAEGVELSGDSPDTRFMPDPAEKPKSCAATTERLDAPASAELKQTIARLARLDGHSMTDIVLDGVQRSAHDTILEHDVIRLNAQESRDFVQALRHPPKPNANLKAAFASYRKNVRPG